MYYPSTYPRKYDQLLKDIFLFLIKKNPEDRKKFMSLIRSFIAKKKKNFSQNSGNFTLFIFDILKRKLKLMKVF